MKLRLPLALAVSAILLAGCGISLAEDIKPPANYIAPTPAPTLGAVFPAQPPDLQQGKALYAVKCAPCHGDTGLGDGSMSMQLPVTVPALGLPEESRTARPADWFRIVTQGNLSRAMPPFSGSLDEQQRWNVVSYALSLHTSGTELQKGESLVKTGCTECSTVFANQAMMASLSDSDLVTTIRSGSNGVPAFGKDLSDMDAYAVAGYLRSLTFAAGVAQVAPTAAETAQATESTAATGQVTQVARIPGTGTPGVVATAPAGSSTATTVGSISGTVLDPDGKPAAGLTVTLHGLQHSTDGTTAPSEAITKTATTAEDGSYSFAEVEMPAQRVFYAEVTYAGVKYDSGAAAVASGKDSISLAPLRLYETSTDTSLLTMQQVHLYTDFGTTGTVQIIEVYAFKNSSKNSVVISTDGKTIPFISLPDGAINPGFEAGQNSAGFVSAGDGVAAVPGENAYSIVAYFNLPYDGNAEFKQLFTLDAPTVLVLVPEGVTASAGELQDMGMQALQGNNFRQYSSGAIKAGSTLDIKLSGKPASSSTSSTAPADHTWLIMGLAAIGLVMIGAGAYFFLRERGQPDGEPEQSEFANRDEVLDAMLALEDLHRGGKIKDAAYNERMEELKLALKGFS